MHRLGDAYQVLFWQPPLADPVPAGVQVRVVVPLLSRVIANVWPSVAVAWTLNSSAPAEVASLRHALLVLGQDGMVFS